MGGEQAALVFTDPPYGVDYDGGTKKREKLAADQHGTDVYAAVLPMVLTASEKKAPIYLWHAYTEGPAAVSALRDAGYDVRSLILWVKNQAQFGALSAHYKQQHEPCLYACRKGVAPYWHGPTNETTVWEHDRATSNDFHPTQKPIALAERAIGNSSVAGALVLDLFGGSGSTLMACEATARRARLMEIDPRYCDVIVRRWEEHTGRKAEQADGP